MDREILAQTQASLVNLTDLLLHTPSVPLRVPLSINESNSQCAVLFSRAGTEGDGRSNHFTSQARDRESEVERQGLAYDDELV